MSEDDEPVALPVDDEPRARDALRETAAPHFLTMPERYEARTPPSPPPVEVRAREPKTHLDPDVWGTGFLRIEEREIPWDVSQALHQRAPQALLRDLFRPERDVYWVEREPLVEGLLDPGGRTALAQARSLRAREPLPTRGCPSTPTMASARRSRCTAGRRPSDARRTRLRAACKHQSAVVFSLKPTQQVSPACR